MNKKFSERMGFVSPKDLLQMDSISLELRNSLWNVLHDFYETRYDNWPDLIQFFAKYYFKVPIDNMPYHDHECKEWIKEKFFKMLWYEVYDIIEFIYTNYDYTKKYPFDEKEKFGEHINLVLEMESSGYRFVSGLLVPISNRNEIDEIENAIENSVFHKLQGAEQHLKTSLNLLSQKPIPDYRNSIKESISSVESIVKLISKKDSQGLSDALKELNNHTEIHGALKSAFEKLYGYTSDESGIRHAILENSEIGFDEAKFMLISCSAFINYLISKSVKAGLLSK